jgi:uncharacterized beta-barrel protein YwiB (DUF1934 family)
MTKKDVVIYIRSLYGYDEGEEDAIDFTTDGLYSFDGDTASLTYQESEVTGMEGTETNVVVSADKVIVDRNGTVTSRMVFRPGEKHAFLYDTPVGSATMHMNTRGLSSRFNEHGGHVEIDYVLDLEHAVVSRNRFKLTVKEQKKMGDRSNG